MGGPSDNAISNLYAGMAWQYITVGLKNLRQDYGFGWWDLIYFSYRLKTYLLGDTSQTSGDEWDSLTSQRSMTNTTALLGTAAGKRDRSMLHLHNYFHEYASEFMRVCCHW